MIMQKKRWEEITAEVGFVVYIFASFVIIISTLFLLYRYLPKGNDFLLFDYVHEEDENQVLVLLYSYRKVGEFKNGETRHSFIAY